MPEIFFHIFSLFNDKHFMNNKSKNFSFSLSGVIWNFFITKRAKLAIWYNDPNLVTNRARHKNLIENHTEKYQKQYIRWFNL